ncbi:MAG: hypothetical protein JWO05_307 [Gemmatimonadetes bacterium]|nr:hypothetical protein [Gemmatimonadota bacterium]
MRRTGLLSLIAGAALVLLELWRAPTSMLWSAVLLAGVVVLRMRFNAGAQRFSLHRSRRRIYGAGVAVGAIWIVLAAASTASDLGFMDLSYLQENPRAGGVDEFPVTGLVDALAGLFGLVMLSAALLDRRSRRRKRSAERDRLLDQASAKGS